MEGMLCVRPQQAAELTWLVQSAAATQMFAHDREMAFVVAWQLLKICRECALLTRMNDTADGIDR